MAFQSMGYIIAAASCEFDVSIKHAATGAISRPDGAQPVVRVGMYEATLLCKT
jgi:hypothetical protein